MTPNNFDPNAWFDAYRNAFAPLMRMQEEGLKTVERLARFQYAVAGDCLESSLAQSYAVVDAKSPTEFLAKQAEIGARFGDKLRVRSQEFMSLTSEAQGSLNQFLKDTTTRTAEVVRDAARETAREAAKEARKAAAAA